ncbi:ribokinase [Lichenicola sp.]|uniref:ribokinase n=1 Tax=Lichenicola sp. TaxID=2804529 RepID=UPI003B00A28D
MSGVARIVVVGSLHYDIIVDAAARPRKGETVTGRSLNRKCGGKGGNQAVAASRAGVATAFVGAVGDDPFGDALVSGLAKAGVDHSDVVAHPDVSSGTSIAIFDDEGDYGAVIVSGSNLLITPGQLRPDLFGTDRILVLQNEIPEAINAQAARSARAHGMTVILNAAPARPFTTDLADFVDVLVVNAIEAEMLGGGTVDGLAQASHAARILCERFPAVVVTAGGDGVAYVDRKGGHHEIAAIPITVRSTHGAGDSFVGTLAAAISRGELMKPALEHANIVAAQLVATPEAERANW